MHIFYINLDRRPDRRAFMERQFSALGLAAERLSALTPDDIGKDGSQTLSPTEAACSSSHFMAWRFMLERGLPCALILEDDSILSSALPAFVTGFPTDRQDWDIVKIETRFRSVDILSMPVAEIAGSALFRSLNASGGSSGYVIFAQAAQKILQSDERFHLPIDCLLFQPESRFFEDQTLLLAQPALVRPVPNDPTIPSADDVLRSDIETQRLGRVFDRSSGGFAATPFGRKLARDAQKLRNILRRIVNRIFFGQRHIRVEFRE